MIDTALGYIQDKLNQHFKNQFSISENKVVISNIGDANGAVAKDADGKILFFLVQCQVLND